MQSMKTVTLRIPDDLHKQIAEAAAGDNRSINSWLTMLARRTLNTPAKEQQ